MSKPKRTPSQHTSSGTVDAVRHFAKLGEEYLQASKILNDGFKSAPKWPIYQTAFLALENFLKAFLLLKGATIEHGHDLRALLNETKAKGLELKVASVVEEAVMKASEFYPDDGSGEWTQVPTGLRGFESALCCNCAADSHRSLLEVRRSTNLERIRVQPFCLLATSPIALPRALMAS